MIRRSSCRLWIDPAETKRGKIKLIDEHIDHPNRIVSANPNMLARLDLLRNCALSLRPSD